MLLAADGDFNLAFVFRVTSADPPTPGNVTHHMKIQAHPGASPGSASHSPRADPVEIGTTGYLRVRALAGAGRGETVSAWTEHVPGTTSWRQPRPDPARPPVDTTPVPPVEQACGDWEFLSGTDQR